MIFGAEGAIALANLILLVGGMAAALLLLIWLGIGFNAKLKAKYQQHPMLAKLVSILLVLLMLPASTMLPTLFNYYLHEKPIYDAQTRKDEQMGAVIKTLQIDDLSAFKLALASCGDYCIGTPNAGAGKYDSLITYAFYDKAQHINAYLEALSIKEAPAPKDCFQLYIEGKVKRDDCLTKVIVN